jgi:hypothetical protein
MLFPEVTWLQHGEATFVDVRQQRTHASCTWHDAMMAAAPPFVFEYGTSDKEPGS